MGRSVTVGLCLWQSGYVRDSGVMSVTVGGNVHDSGGMSATVGVCLRWWGYVRDIGGMPSGVLSVTVEVCS